MRFYGEQSEHGKFVLLPTPLMISVGKPKAVKPLLGPRYSSKL